MRWSYKTVHFELKKEGLLGGSFLDETEVEEQLNDYGRSGWELTSVIEVQDGIIAFFKQPLDLAISSRPRPSAENEENPELVVEETHEADDIYEFDDQYDQQEQNYYPEAHYEDDYDVDDSLITENEEQEPLHLDDPRESFADQDSDDQQEEHQDKKGIGAIRIE